MLLRLDRRSSGTKRRILARLWADLRIWRFLCTRCRRVHVRGCGRDSTAEARKSTVAVDLALHLGEVQYGNIGAVDRLDFTVIGPAVNEVARIEALCEPLGCQVLVSAELAEAVDASCRLVPLGGHALRGVREMQEIYGLDLG